MFRALGWRIKSSHFSNSYSAPHIPHLIAAEFVRAMRAELTRTRVRQSAASCVNGAAERS